MSQDKPTVTYLVLALVVVGVVARVVTLSRLEPSVLCGADFPVFYAGGQLAGSPALYSPEAAQTIHRREAGCTSPSSTFIRLPFFAAFMWPLAQLPFSWAFTLWRLASVAAVLGFVWYWRPPRLWSALACAWSLPLAWNVTNGQDVAFLLLWVAIGVALVRNRHHFLAGLVLSLCAAKFHLFVLLPVLIVAQRLWTVGCGLVAGSSLLLAASFAVGGTDWPLRFFAAVTQPAIDSSTVLLTNVRGLVRGTLAWEIVLGLLVAALVWYICRRAAFEGALCAVLVGGVLVSHHLVRADAALFLPVALTLVADARLAWLRAVALIPILPTTYFLAALPAFSQLFLIAILLLFGGIALDAKMLSSAPGVPRAAAHRE